MVSPENSAKIALWRQKAAEGTLTIEEMREAVSVLRAGRVAAQRSSDESRTKRAKKEIKTADALLDELGGL